MILVDTSIWIDHLRNSDAGLVSLLENGQVLVHPFVTGELACGALRHRAEILGLLSRLPQSAVALDAEVLGMIEHHGLAGTGLGYIDVHLLASAALTPFGKLWSRDKTLAAAARRLGCARPEA